MQSQNHRKLTAAVLGLSLLALGFAAQELRAQPYASEGATRPLSDSTSIAKLRVVIETSSIDKAGTDANVYLAIGGVPYYLDNPAVNDFEKGSTFSLELEPRVVKTLGDLRRSSIRLFHDNSGNGPGWHVKSLRLSVRPGSPSASLQSYKCWTGIGWLALDGAPYYDVKRSLQLVPDGQNGAIRETLQNSLADFQMLDERFRMLGAPMTQVQQDQVKAQILGDMTEFLFVTTDLDLIEAVDLCRDLVAATNQILGRAYNFFLDQEARELMKRYTACKPDPLTGVTGKLQTLLSESPSPRSPAFSSTLGETYKELSRLTARTESYRHDFYQWPGYYQQSGATCQLASPPIYAESGRKAEIGLDNWTDLVKHRAMMDQAMLRDLAAELGIGLSVDTPPQVARVSFTRATVWNDRDSQGLPINDPGEIHLDVTVGSASLDPIEFPANSGQSKALDRQCLARVAPGGPLAIAIEGREEDSWPFSDQGMGGFSAAHALWAETLPDQTRNSLTSDGFTLDYSIHALAELKTLWSSQRGAAQMAASQEAERAAASSGFGLKRGEGYVFALQGPRPGTTIKLETFYRASDQKYITVASDSSRARATREGYSPLRVEGYVYPAGAQPSHTTALVLYRRAWWPYDYLLTTGSADFVGQLFGYNPYLRVNTEGYVIGPPDVAWCG